MAAICKFKAQQFVRPPDGLHRDGDRLYVRLRDEGRSRRSVFQYCVANGQRHHGLGVKFEHVRRLIAPADKLVADMTWAPYDLIENSGRKIVFRRRA